MYRGWRFRVMGCVSGWRFCNLRNAGRESCRPIKIDFNASSEGIHMRRWRGHITKPTGVLQPTPGAFDVTLMDSE